MPSEATRGSTERYEIFTPLVPSALERTANDAEFNFLVVARLNDGVSIRAAQSELDGIEKATAQADRLSIHLSVIVEPFSQEITGDARKPLWVLLAAIAGVLLMACVNLATLQIVRGVARDHDTALRSALGAGAARLVEGVLIENLLIGLVGGLAGEPGPSLRISSAPSQPRIHRCGRHNFGTWSCAQHNDLQCRQRDSPEKAACERSRHLMRNFFQKPDQGQ
jgi:hypothetical protein